MERERVCACVAQLHGCWLVGSIFTGKPGDTLKMSLSILWIHLVQIVTEKNQQKLLCTEPASQLSSASIENAPCVSWLTLQCCFVAETLRIQFMDRLNLSSYLLKWRQSFMSAHHHFSLVQNVYVCVCLRVYKTDLCHRQKTQTQQKHLHSHSHSHTAHSRDIENGINLPIDFRFSLPICQ